MQTRCPGCGKELQDRDRDFPCPSCGAAVISSTADGGDPSRIPPPTIPSRTAPPDSPGNFAGPLHGTLDDEEAIPPVVSIAMAEGPKWRTVLMALQHLARLAGILVFFMAMALSLAALLAGVPEVFRMAPESERGAALYILAPQPIAFAELTGPSFLAWYAALVAAILLSFASIAWSERGRIRAFLALCVKRFRAPDRRSGDGFVQLPQLFLAVFFFDFIYTLVVEATGNAPRAPDFGEYPRWYLLFTFAHASVYEELLARIFLLGLPLLIAHVFAHASGEASGRGLLEYLRCRTTKGLRGYFLGGGFGIGPLEALFLIGSSLMFGLAHVPGWDLWKVLPTFIAGLAFGYLFLRVGLHAAIALHFGFDYLYLGLVLVPGFDELWVVFLPLWLLVGAFYFGHYASQTLRWLREIFSRYAESNTLPARPC
ncbi:MAG: CPBP family glutamic-type intramembrane protease [Thermoplasmata archaeon]